MSSLGRPRPRLCICRVPKWVPNCRIPSATRRNNWLKSTPAHYGAQRADRLLPQPGGFEGLDLLVGKEALHPCRAAVVVKRPDGPSVEIQLDATSGSTGRRELVDPDLVPLDAELDWLDLLSLEGVWLHPGPQCIRASQRRLAPRWDELDLGMGHFHRALEVAAIERLIGAAKTADDLLISIGHRPGSIPCNGLSSRRQAVSGAQYFGGKTEAGG